MSYNRLLSMQQTDIPSADQNSDKAENYSAELNSQNDSLTTLNYLLEDQLEQLKASNEHFNFVLSNIDIPLLILDTQLRVKLFTPAICKIFELSAADVGRPIADISHFMINLDLQRLIKKQLTARQPVKQEVQTVHAEYFTLSIKPLRSNDNIFVGVILCCIDITELKLEQQSLTRSRQQIELFLASTGEAIYGVDTAGHCNFVNNKFMQQFGYKANELLGNHLHELINHTQKDGSPYCWTESSVYRCLLNGSNYRGQLDIAWRKNGTSFPAYTCVEPVLENGVITGAVVVVRDVTEDEARSQRLNHLAKHDSLTGLVNRREFEDRLADILESSQQEQCEHIMCYLDLDQFKHINDICGHLAGDELLRQIAGLLVEHTRKRDTLARLGGDEFGLLMECCDIHEGSRIAHNLRDVVADYRFQWEAKTYTVGVSIGVISITPHTGDIKDLFKAADTACYIAKENGRNRIHIYSEPDSSSSIRHGNLLWINKIKQALKQDRLQLYLQPIVPLNASQTERVSYEALLRMRDSDGSIILPDDFLGAAERYNLSIKIDCWVIKRIFTWFSKHLNTLQDISRLHINLSGQSLCDEQFMDFTLDALKKYRLPGDKICFEITEKAAITNLARAKDFMRTMQQSGCVFALDDFGAGLSSFESVKTLPVEYLKIPAAFVKNIINDPTDMAMVKSINEIGQVMEKKTIAEGVETEDILQALAELGVDSVQGYFSGRPALINEVFHDCKH